MAETVLVVDDEESMREILTSWLEDSGYNTLSSSTGTEALREIYQHRPDLIIADVMMPDMDGYRLCNLASEISSSPIILLTALGQEKEKVQGFEMGADDYIVKPIGMNEFLARVRALLRRKPTTSAPEPEYQGYSDGLLNINRDRHEIFIRGDLVEFTPTEFKILCYLTERAGKACSLKDIIANVWESPHYPVEVIKWHMAKLRSKVEEEPSKPKHLLTVRGVGYRYEPPSDH